ncbi:dephospho-CoA kinase [Candidatus Omnitrophus magneticus]|uniref:Dephospho-CoA kinase n=1 Tax=Candidatus Omnitrophus magneticus TaxID=1609969 RepID=A0A0F0CR30_9BACT|nr:dephospho-CoA kinase [Candidatus Omnitrophus magneticus]
MPEKIIIGITGSFSSGKTVISAMFEKKGARRIDVDAVGHELLSEPVVKEKLVKFFGKEILQDEKIDRRKLGNIVFFDDAKLAVLNNLVHPMIVERVRQTIVLYNDKIILIDAALLFEMGLDKVADKIIIILSNYDEQIKRAIDRGYTKEVAERIMSRQTLSKQSLKRADYIIENNGSFNIIKDKVEEIWRKVQK